MNNKKKNVKSKQRFKKALSLLVLTALATGVCLTATACPAASNNKGIVNLEGVVSDGANVKMSVLYTDTKTRMKFGESNIPYRPLGIVQGEANGNKQYTQGDLKPAWEKLQANLNFTINDVTPTSASSVADAYKKLLANKFNGVNLLSGSASTIVEDGMDKKYFVNLADYYEYLPNLKAFIDENEIVKKSVTSSDGKMYYAPYCDGLNDIESMFICRVDWVEKLLDGGDETAFDTATPLNSATPYKAYYKTMNTTFEVADEDDTVDHKQTVTVSYGLGESVIDKQNALQTKNGESLTKALKAHIKKYYLDTGVIKKCSDFFCGQNACYNADELVALWRCVKTNPALLTGDATKKMVPFYPRASSADRTNAIIQLAQIWGVRGYDSRNSYFYLDEDGILQDSRVSDDRMDSLEYLHQIYSEGLILQDYEVGVSGGVSDFRDRLNKNNTGFMTYDYNQTTTILNDTLKDGIVRNLSPILFPVADWDNKATAHKDGGYSITGDNVLYQYTESWRSVKSEGWAITAGTANDPAVLKKCLEIIDYMYSDEGHILMSYGPDVYIEKDGAGKTVMIDYYNEKVPKIATDALNELKHKDRGNGNYTNYYRYYVGATLPIGYVKEQGMEYQTVDEKGKVGLEYLMNAVKWRTLKHSEVSRSGNVQNTLIPSTFALSFSDSEYISTHCSELMINFANTAGTGKNIFHDYILFGFNNPNAEADRDTLTSAGLKAFILETCKGNVYISRYQMTYDKMYDLNK